ncbi:MAG: hypothetical protein PHX21_13790 [bacterium]|nr:hypothetical protein [bacterium]
MSTEELEIKLGKIETKIDAIQDTLKQNDLPGIRTDVAWLKQFFWLLAGTVLSAWIALIFFVFKIK